MTEEKTHRDLAAQARLAAALLAQGRALDRWSLAFTALALAGLLLNNPPGLLAQSCLTACVLLGLVQKYYALRVGLDEPVFAAWAEGWMRDGANPTADLAAFDQSLKDLGLTKAQEAKTRPLPERVHGALGLFARQAGAFVLQVIALIGAVWL